MSILTPARPVTMSPPVWAFLCSAWERVSPGDMPSLLQEEGYACPAVATDQERFAAVLEMPGPFLLRMGILKQPELLRGAVLSLGGEPGLFVDYVVKARTVDGLRAGDGVLVLYRLLDNEEYAVPRHQLVKAIHGGGLVDYIEKESLDTQA